MEGLVRLMVSPPEFTGPVNLGNPVEFTIRQLAELVIELTGAGVGIEDHPLPEDDPMQRCPDITLAKNNLGWQPSVQVRDGLAKTIDYFKTQI